MNKCEFCTSRPATWWALDYYLRTRYACRRHRERLGAFCGTIAFPIAKVRVEG